MSRQIVAEASKDVIVLEIVIEKVWSERVLSARVEQPICVVENALKGDGVVRLQNAGLQQTL